MEHIKIADSNVKYYKENVFEIWQVFMATGDKTEMFLPLQEIWNGKILHFCLKMWKL